MHKTIDITNGVPKYGAPGPWTIEGLWINYFLIFVFLYFPFSDRSTPVVKGEGIIQLSMK